MTEIKEYDEKGNLIHRRDSTGFEWWHEYDENNNVIHSRNSNGYEEWREYDENNNEIHFRDSTGHVVDTTIVQFPKIVWPNEI